LRAYGEKRHAHWKEHGGHGDPEALKQRFAERFKQADADGDGALSKAEAEAGMPRLAKHFDAIDANKDGKITQEELRAYGAKRHAHWKEHGGRGGHGDPEALKQRFAERFKQADADGDGALSKAEAEKSMPRIAQHFDEIDSNHDGKITQDEIMASMEKHRARRKEHGGEQHGPQGEKN
jgi:Ca2+-binding EF-hand superfamily protein